MEKLINILKENYIDKDNIRKQIAKVNTPKKKHTKLKILIPILLVIAIALIVYFFINM